MSKKSEDKKRKSVVEDEASEDSGSESERELEDKSPASDSDDSSEEDSRDEDENEYDENDSFVARSGSEDEDIVVPRRSHPMVAALRTEKIKRREEKSKRKDKDEKKKKKKRDKKDKKDKSKSKKVKAGDADAEGEADTQEVEEKSAAQVAEERRCDALKAHLTKLGINGIPVQQGKVAFPVTRPVIMDGEKALASALRSVLADHKAGASDVDPEELWKAITECKTASAAVATLTPLQQVVWFALACHPDNKTLAFRLSAARVYVVPAGVEESVAKLPPWEKRTGVNDGARHVVVGGAGSSVSCDDTKVKSPDGLQYKTTTVFPRLGVASVNTAQELQYVSLVGPLVWIVTVLPKKPPKQVASSSSATPSIAQLIGQEKALPAKIKWTGELARREVINALLRLAPEGGAVAFTLTNGVKFPEPKAQIPVLSLVKKLTELLSSSPNAKPDINIQAQGICSSGLLKEFGLHTSTVAVDGGSGVITIVSAVVPVRKNGEKYDVSQSDAIHPLFADTAFAAIPRAVFDKLKAKDTTLANVLSLLKATNNNTWEASLQMAVADDDDDY